jgi:predicted nucleotidyltransferase
MIGLHQIPEDVRALIDSRLDAIEREQEVRILFAIESGSRAWGFAGPGSDYDVRFVYVHAQSWYLALDGRRDVIEGGEGLLDISGWDLKKALKLLIKPNPVLLEWLRSPIVYRADTPVVSRMAALGEAISHVPASTHHYLRLCESQYRALASERAVVPLKKYFYSLRPALALMWLRLHPERPVPMSLPELRAGLDLPVELTRSIDHLLERKAAAEELGRGPRLIEADAFIEREIALAREGLQVQVPPKIDVLGEANALFRELVMTPA